MDEDTEKVIRRIEDNCALLYHGYKEKADYTVAVAYHRGQCPHYGKSTLPKNDCECPVVNEKRVRNLSRPGLLTQLREFQQNKDTDRNPKSERGAPRVKTAGRPPGDMAGFFLLDELESDIVRTVDRVLLEVGGDRTWAVQPVRDILQRLHAVCEDWAESRPDQLRVIDSAVIDWVKRSRSALKITTGESIFESVVCGNCGGGLGTPWGNEGADVRCVGSPSEPPCGHTYPASEWVTLYQRSREGS